MPVDESFRQEGTSLPKGAGQQLDAALEVAAAAPEVSVEVTDARDLDRLAQGMEPEQTQEDDFASEFFAPSDFPLRPVTHGASFGPGGNGVRTPRVNDRTHLNRIATRMLERKDEVPDEALVWAMRVLQGE